jgi:hypothetical protein
MILFTKLDSSSYLSIHYMYRHAEFQRVQACSQAQDYIPLLLPKHDAYVPTAPTTLATLAHSCY